MESIEKHLSKWQDFLRQEISVESQLIMQKDLAMAYINLAKKDNKDSIWSYDILERTLVLCLEKITRVGYSPDALPGLVEVAIRIGVREKDYFANAFLKRLARHIGILIAGTANNNDWRNAAIMAEDWQKIPTKLMLKEKFLMARVWENIGHLGRAKRCYREALFHIKADSGCFCFTPYTLLLSMLLLPDWKKTAFIVGGYIRGEIVENLANEEVPGLYHLETAGNVDCFRDVLKDFSVWAKDNKLQFIGQDNMREAEYFIDENFSVVEDGLGNYCPRGIYLPLEDGHEHMCYGFGDRVKNIYLLGRTIIPEEIKNKVTVIDLQEKWDRKTLEEQAEILDVLSVPMAKIIDVLNSGRDHIFLTQHYFNQYDEEKRKKHITLCQKILSQYDHNRVIIKVHPGGIEPIDYEKLFPDCYIMRDSFPVEILKLVGLENKISKIISVYSTAIYGFFDQSKIDCQAALCREVMRGEAECERDLDNMPPLPDA